MTRSRVAIEVIIHRFKGMLLSAQKASIRRNSFRAGYQPGEGIATVVQGHRLGCAVWSATETKCPPRLFRASFLSNDYRRRPVGRARRVNPKENVRHGCHENRPFREIRGF
jgi:hypothetical protein